MTLTLNVEICNREMKFTELIYETYRAVLKLGCQIVKAYLEAMDARLMETRDRKRYRNKGLKRTCVKTILGAIEYERRVYKDTEAESADENLVYLLDEAYKIEKIGMYETSL